MKIIVKDTEEQFNTAAALEIAKQAIIKSDSCIGLSTGSTTKDVFSEIGRLHSNWGVDFSRISTFNLDEYVGIEHENPKSCYFRTYEQLISKINIVGENVHIPDGTCKSPGEEYRRYEMAIEKAGGIDLQILGIGENGHIGFNEPATPFGLAMHIVNLTEATRRGKADFFGGIQYVPEQGITMGIRLIMQAKRLLLLAKGKNKAEIIKKTLLGPISPEVPASVVQLHPDLLVILDRDAYSFSS